MAAQRRELLLISTRLDDFTIVSKRACSTRIGTRDGIKYGLLCVESGPDGVNVVFRVDPAIPPSVPPDGLCQIVHGVNCPWNLAGASGNLLRVPHGRHWIHGRHGISDKHVMTSAKPITRFASSATIRGRQRFADRCLSRVPIRRRRPSRDEQLQPTRLQIAPASGRSRQHSFSRPSPYGRRGFSIRLTKHVANRMILGSGAAPR